MVPQFSVSSTSVEFTPPVPAATRRYFALTFDVSTFAAHAVHELRVAAVDVTGAVWAPMPPVHFTVEREATEVFVSPLLVVSGSLQLAWRVHTAALPLVATVEVCVGTEAFLCNVVPWTSDISHACDTSRWHQDAEACARIAPSQFVTGVVAEPNTPLFGCVRVVNAGLESRSCSGALLYSPVLSTSVSMSWPSLGIDVTVQQPTMPLVPVSALSGLDFVVSWSAVDGVAAQLAALEYSVVSLPGVTSEVTLDGTVDLLPCVQTDIVPWTRVSALSKSRRVEMSPPPTVHHGCYIQARVRGVTHTGDVTAFAASPSATVVGSLASIVPGGVVVEGVASPDGAEVWVGADSVLVWWSANVDAPTAGDLAKATELSTVVSVCEHLDSAIVAGSCRLQAELGVGSNRSIALSTAQLVPGVRYAVVVAMSDVFGGGDVVASLPVVFDPSPPAAVIGQVQLLPGLPFDISVEFGDSIPSLRDLHLTLPYMAMRNVTTVTLIAQLGGVFVDEETGVLSLEACASTFYGATLCDIMPWEPIAVDDAGRGTLLIANSSVFSSDVAAVVMHVRAYSASSLPSDPLPSRLLLWSLPMLLALDTPVMSCSECLFDDIRGIFMLPPSDTTTSTPVFVDWSAAVVRPNVSTLYAPAAILLCVTDYLSFVNVSSNNFTTVYVGHFDVISMVADVEATSSAFEVPHSAIESRMTLAGPAMLFMYVLDPSNESVVLWLGGMLPYYAAPIASGVVLDVPSSVVVGGTELPSDVSDVDLLVGPDVGVVYRKLCGDIEASAFAQLVEYEVSLWRAANVSWDGERQRAWHNQTEAVSLLQQVRVPANSTAVALSSTGVASGDEVCASAVCVDMFGRRSAIVSSDCTVVDMRTPGNVSFATATRDGGDAFSTSSTTVHAAWQIDVDGWLPQSSALPVNPDVVPMGFTSDVFVRVVRVAEKPPNALAPPSAYPNDTNPFCLSCAATSPRVTVGGVDGVLLCAAAHEGELFSPESTRESVFASNSTEEVEASTLCAFTTTCDADCRGWNTADECVLRAVLPDGGFAAGGIEACYRNPLDPVIVPVTPNEVLVEADLSRPLFSGLARLGGATSACCASQPFAQADASYFDLLVQSSALSVVAASSPLLALGVLQHSGGERHYLVTVSTAAGGAATATLLDGGGDVLSSRPASGVMVVRSIDTRGFGSSAVVAQQSSLMLRVCWQLLQLCDDVTPAALLAVSDGRPGSEPLAALATRAADAVFGDAIALDDASTPTSLAVVLIDRRDSVSTLVTLSCTNLTPRSGCAAWSSSFVGTVVGTVSAVRYSIAAGVVVSVTSGAVSAFDVTCSSARRLDLVTACPQCRCVRSTAASTPVLDVSVAGAGADATLAVTCATPSAVFVDNLRYGDFIVASACSGVAGTVLPPARVSSCGFSDDGAAIVSARARASSAVVGGVSASLVSVGPLPTGRFLMLSLATVVGVDSIDGAAACRVVGSFSSPPAFHAGMAVGGSSVLLSGSMFAVHVPTVGDSTGAVLLASFCEPGRVLVGGGVSVVSEVPRCVACPAAQASFGGRSRQCGSCADTTCVASRAFEHTVSGLSLQDGHTVMVTLLVRSAVDGDLVETDGPMIKVCTVTLWCVNSMSTVCRCSMVQIDSTAPVPSWIDDGVANVSDATPGVDATIVAHPVTIGALDESDYQRSSRSLACYFGAANDTESGVLAVRVYVDCRLMWA